MKPLPLRPYPNSLLIPEKQSSPANAVIIFVGVCSILYFGQDILIPIVFAVLLAILLTPLVRFIHSRGAPKSIAVTTVVFFSMLLIAATTFAVGQALTRLASDLPAYEYSLRQKARSLRLAAGSSDAIDQAASVLKDLQKELESQSPASDRPGNVVKPIPVEVYENRLGPLDPLITAVSAIAHPLVQIGIVILMLTFILFNREDLRNRLVRLAGTDDIHRTTIALDEAGQKLSRLFLGLSAINATTGAFIGVSLFLLGIPAAFLWGMLTALLRFVPFVGTIMAALFPIIMALAIGDGWYLPLAVAGLVLIAELAAGQILEPIFLGRVTGVSATAIVVSAAFWASIWGPIGLVLATPMTIGLMVLGRNIESLKFLEILFGAEPVLGADHIFYQRILAGDALEAAGSASVFEHEGQLQEYLETIAVPALLMADRDQRRGVLSREKSQEVADAFSETLNEIWTDISTRAYGPAPIVLVAHNGSLNAAATEAFSALLRLKQIRHEIFAENIIAPEQTSGTARLDVRSVCICSLSPPSAPKASYVERRLKLLFPKARFLNVAWQESDETSAQTLTPMSALGLLPSSYTQSQ